MLSPVSSVTHAHLAYVLAAEMRVSTPNANIPRILDAGCGSGQLLLALHRHLPTLLGRGVDLAGFDVSDVRVQKDDFFEGTRRLLDEEAPDRNWREMLTLIDTKSAWPYEDESFDAVVSNQVLEHVSDLDAFMSQLSRVLRPGGVSVNLFPVRSLVIEGHVGAPFAHRIASDDVRRAYLATFARLGLSRLGPMRREQGQEFRDFGETRAEYVATQTNYRSFRELARTAHRHGLTASYRWTPQFYALKLGYMTGRDTSRFYSRTPLRTIAEWVSFGILSRISSVTVRFSKQSSYDPNGEFAGHLG